MLLGLEFCGDTADAGEAVLFHRSKMKPMFVCLFIHSFSQEREFVLR